MSRHITAYIALGSNLGDRADNIKKALDMLSDLDGVSTVTPGSVTETKPLGPKNQPDYLNTVAKITTTLDPEILYEKTAAIEDALGRERSSRQSTRERPSGERRCVAAPIESWSPEDAVLGKSRSGRTIRKTFCSIGEVHGYRS